MLGPIIILAITAISLILSLFFLPKIKIKNFEISTYWIVTILGAIFMLAFGFISFKEVGQRLTANVAVNPLKILCIFLSMTYLSIFEDEMGFFKYVAIKASKFAGKSQLKLFFIIYLIVSILTIFTSNDIVILTFTPFICYFAKHTKINPLPYLIMEFAAANTWSMFLEIGNPTNIYLSSALNIDFFSYLANMALPTLFAGLIELLILYFLFHKSLKQPLEDNEEDIQLQDKTNVVIGLVILFITIILLAISSYINIEMWLICLSAFVLLSLIYLIISIFKKEKPTAFFNSLKRLPYQLVPFVLGMFIIVLGLNKAGVTNELHNLLEGDIDVVTYGFSSFLLTNVMNNIPMSVFYSYVLNSYAVSDVKSIYVTIISSNIGAFLTPLGALAGIMFTDLVKKQDIKLSFLTFSKYGVIIAIPTLLMAFLGLIIVL